MTYCCIFKIDRLYDWKKSPDTDVAITLKKQKKNTKDEFEERAKAIIVEFAKQVGWNIWGSFISKNDSKGGVLWVGGVLFGAYFGVFIFPFQKTIQNIKRKVSSLVTCWCLPLMNPNLLLFK